MNATQTCVCLDVADCNHLQNQNLTCAQLSQLYDYWGCDCCTVAVACIDESVGWALGFGFVFGGGIVVAVVYACWCVYQSE